MAEDNGDVKDFKLLPTCGYLYVLLGIFHSFITKRPIPGSSVWAFPLEQGFLNWAISL